MGRDVVFTFSTETYTDAVQRGMMRPPDRLLSTLLGSDQVDRLLVANPFRSPGRHVIRGLLGRHAEFPTSPTRALHTPMRVRRDPATDEAGARAEYRQYGESLRRAAHRIGIDAGNGQPAMLTTHPVVAGFMPGDWTTAITYFGRDDWASMPDHAEMHEVYRAAYGGIRDTQRPVAAVSQEIIDRIAPTGPHLVVPNGVEPAEWRGPLPAEPAWLAEIPHPRALYTGTLDTRLDLVGLVDLARRRPDVHTVLMGPQPDPGHLDALRDLPNVHIRAGVGRDELIAVTRNVDFSLLAHRDTPLTRAMSPLKVYEYLAAGLPVISIDLQPVRGIDDRVIIVDSVTDFADAVDTALELGRASEAEREAFLVQNSWTKRHEAILELTLGSTSA